MYKVWKYKLDHVAFWLITLVFYAFTRRHILETEGFAVFAIDVLIRNTLIALACYANIYLLFEKFFKTKRYLLYSALLLVLVLVYAAMQTVAEGMINGHSYFLPRAYYHFSVGLFYIAFTLALELSKRWYRQELLLHRMESEKLQTELQYLKAQLNPHFLFNCINTIYFQIDPLNTAARESLLRFSEMLRYQLYECNVDKIPIEKETLYLESYVDLQRLRKESNNSIEFHKGNEVNGFTIAPLLLLPFVENAFKHLSTNAENNNVIRVNLSRRNEYFYFSVINSCDETTNYSSSGIGLKNVQRRLDLLYPNKHKLEIQQVDNCYSVQLQLEL